MNAPLLEENSKILLVIEEDSGNIVGNLGETAKKGLSNMLKNFNGVSSIVQMGVGIAKAAGTRVANYGTILATIADVDKESALPLIRRFYNLGFNIEATKGTAKFLKEHGIKTRLRGKISQGSEEILESIKKGYVTYVINTTSEGVNQNEDGRLIRRAAIDNNVAVFTCLDTVKVLLDVLEEITMGISVIDKE